MTVSTSFAKQLNHQDSDTLAHLVFHEMMGWSCDTAVVYQETVDRSLASQPVDIYVLYISPARLVLDRSKKNTQKAPTTTRIVA